MEIEIIEKSNIIELEMVVKYNPYHGKDGRFTTAGNAASFTIGSKSGLAWDEKNVQRAIEREKKRTAGTSKEEQKQEALREAKTVLERAGLGRYDKVQTSDYPATVQSAYHAMQTQFEDGKAISGRWSKKTLDSVGQKNKEERLRSAKRLFGADLDDYAATDAFRSEQSRCDAIDNFISSKRKKYEPGISVDGEYLPF